MRRSSFAIVLIALALLGRILAPMAVEARGFDPLTDAPICAHDGSVPASQDGDKSDAAHAKTCALSCCHVAPAFFAPPAATTSIVRLTIAMSWTAVIANEIAVVKPSTLRARGPPSLS